MKDYSRYKIITTNKVYNIFGRLISSKDGFYHFSTKEGEELFVPIQTTVVIKQN